MDSEFTLRSDQLQFGSNFHKPRFIEHAAPRPIRAISNAMQSYSSGRSKPEYVQPPASKEIPSSSSIKNVKKPQTLALQERTNSTTMYAEATSLYEVTLEGVELPTPTRVTVHDVVPFHSTLDSRRMQRYFAAEEDLARRFEKCQSEMLPVDLQIRALKEVTSVLSAHARDARERAGKLRELLVDRDVDPETYESLQRERWIQEHRQNAVDEEAKVVQQQLSILSNGLPPGNVSQRSQGAEDEEKRRRNLIKFLGDSSKRPSVRIRKTTSFLVERPQKRRTLDKVSSMHLQATTVSRPSFQPLRPMSLDGWTRQSRRTSELVRAEPIHVPPVSLLLVSEDDSDEVVSSPTETASSFPSIFTAKSYLSTPPSTATTLPASRLASAGTKTDAEDENGTATILLDTHLSKAHYNPREIDAPLPDYALDLFARFDYDIDITISNTSERPSSSDVGPRPAHLQKSAPLPPSSYLQVPSFSSPKPQEPKNARLKRPSSYRQLGTLFSIPEAVSSRIGFNTGDKKPHDREAVLSKSPSKSSLASTTIVSEGVKIDKLTTKIKKRLSILRLGRSS